AKETRRIILHVGQQLGVESAKEVGRHRDDGNPRELAGGTEPAVCHDKEWFVVEARLEAADIDIGSGIAQRLEVVAIGHVQIAGREVARADQQVAAVVCRPGGLDLWQMRDLLPDAVVKLLFPRAYL